MPHRLLLVALLAALALGSVARADEKDFAIDHLELALTSEEFLATEGRAYGPPWSWRAGAGYVVTDKPLIADLPGGGMTTLVHSRSMLDLYGAVVLPLGFSIAAELPVLLYQTGTGVDKTGGLGDLRILARYDFTSHRAFTAAFLFEAHVPTATPDAFLGDGSLVFVPRFVFGWRRSWFHVGVNLGLRLREERVWGDLDLQHEIVAALALAARPRPWLEAFVELHADTAFGSAAFTEQSSPLEGLVGVGSKWRNLRLRGAVGGGLVDGYGAPHVRGIVTLTYESPVHLRRPVVAEAQQPPVRPEAPETEPPAQPEVDRSRPDVTVSAEVIRLKRPLRFAPETADLPPDESDELDELAAAIRHRPWIATVWILAPVDEAGPASFGFQMSELRAQRIARALVDRGVPAERVRTLAFGERKPWFSDAQDRERLRTGEAVFLIEKHPAAAPEPKP